MAKAALDSLSLDRISDVCMDVMQFERVGIGEVDKADVADVPVATNLLAVMSVAVGKEGIRF